MHAAGLVPHHRDCCWGAAVPAALAQAWRWGWRLPRVPPLTFSIQQLQLLQDANIVVAARGMGGDAKSRQPPQAGARHAAQPLHTSSRMPRSELHASGQPTSMPLSAAANGKHAAQRGLAAHLPG